MPTLGALPVGAIARITAVRAGRLEVRMASMGLRPGSEVRIVAHAASGNRIVRVGDARLTLARELAAAIDVEVVRADVQ